MTTLQDIIRRHKATGHGGITSVCSAHPLVIETALEGGLRHDQPLVLIEATSNQVNQDGGYTGMTPVAFRDYVFAIADRIGFPRERLVLGGDHLGPNAWTAESADSAMAKAEVMVAGYVAAGFGKIHLDCSMSCADDPVPLPEQTVAERAARLAAAAEGAVDAVYPVYVIGTEVPVPGGAAEDLDALTVTDPAAALATIDMHRNLFAAAGLADAWSRVIATVVQPGVEFDHDKVIDFRPAAADILSAAIEPVPGIVYEAHSTDYQTPSALAALVRGHFAVLKVGPGVTFALREALWALDAMEKELFDPDHRANLRAVTLERMKAAPDNWRKYYHASGQALIHQFEYSLSDRIRYYWPDPEVEAARVRLFGNLELIPPPLPMISQYLPSAYQALRAGDISNTPSELVRAHIAATLDAYHGACQS